MAMPGRHIPHNGSSFSILGSWSWFPDSTASHHPCPIRYIMTFRVIGQPCPALNRRSSPRHSTAQDSLFSPQLSPHPFPRPSYPRLSIARPCNHRSAVQPSGNCPCNQQQILNTPAKPRARQQFPPTTSAGLANDRDPRAASRSAHGRYRSTPQRADRPYLLSRCRARRDHTCC